MVDEQAEMAQHCDSLTVEGYETNHLREEAEGKRRKMEEVRVASRLVKEVEEALPVATRGAEAEVLKMALGEEAAVVRTRSTSWLVEEARGQEPLLLCWMRVKTNLRS